MSGADGWSLAALAVMAVVTYAMRAGGYWLMGRVPFTPRVRRMIEALPGSIIAAMVLPIIVRMGEIAVLAVLSAALVMAWRRKELLAVAVGIGVAVLARHLT